MGHIEFNDGVARFFETFYRRRDVLRRRALVYDALAAQPGERILDVGCGPGFYVSELLDRVGTEGSVTGVDPAPAMLAAAAKRVEGHSNVAFHEADGRALPVGEGEYDGVVAVQVLEYIEEVTVALAEMHRALRPGGRVVIWDVDWATVSWHTEDPLRMRRVLDGWDRHLVHVSLPRTLARRLRDAGFEDVTMQAHAFATNELDRETYGGGLVDQIPGYCVDKGGVDAADAEAWRAEQIDLGARGQFSFACIQFCFAGRKVG